MACRDYTNAKTTVFWDMEDFPMPSGRHSFYEMIKSALENEGYHGDVSIRVYGEKKPQDMNLDGVIAFVPKREKFSRLEKMMLDIGFWAMDNPEPHRNPRNLVVIAKDSEIRTSFVSFLESLMSCSYNVFFAMPKDINPKKVQVPELNNVWYWEGLLAGHEPLSRQEAYFLSKEIWVGFREERKQWEEKEDNSPCIFCPQFTGHNAPCVDCEDK